VNLTKQAIGARLGRFVVECRESEPPEEVVEKLRCNLLHDLSCAMAAYTEGPVIWPLVVDRGPAESTLLCEGTKVDAEHAAFANAVLMHARAQDDTYFSAKSHLGSSVIPPSLALAEQLGADGERFTRAVIAGYEVGAAVGDALEKSTTPRGFRASMLYGTLGSAAACASLLGLDEEGVANAIAIASSFSGGLSQTWIEGSTEWRWELGMAARNGLWAARLASNGAVGASNWLEGPAGFAHAFAGQDSFDEDFAELGERWRIMDVIYKPYPVCNITQSPVEAAMSLVIDNDVEADEIESIRCLLNPVDRAYPGTLNWGPFDDVGASLMSAPFCVAMAIKDRDATLAGLHNTDDPVMRELVARTEVLADERLPELASRIELTTTTGERHVRELIPDDSTYGWDWDGVLTNSRRLHDEMEISSDAFEGLGETIRALTELDSVEPLLRASIR
jgi:2-methylcitrate dehydratase PrpD